MKYGLTEIEWKKITDVFARYDEIEQAILYGSRAKGCYKPFSDVDITLAGSLLTHSSLNRLAWELDDLLLPYQFDLSIFQRLTNPELIESILRTGITVYRKSK